MGIIEHPAELSRTAESTLARTKPRFTTTQVPNLTVRKLSEFPKRVNEQRTRIPGSDDDNLKMLHCSYRAHGAPDRQAQYTFRRFVSSKQVSMRTLRSSARLQLLMYQRSQSIRPFICSTRAVSPR